MKKLLETLMKYWPIIAVITGALGSSFAYMHAHAEDAVNRGDLEQKALINMNMAEIQLLKVKQELDRVIMKPESERTEYDNINIDQLKSDLAHWTARTREIEAQN